MKAWAGGALISAGNGERTRLAGQSGPLAAADVWLIRTDALADPSAAFRTCADGAEREIAARFAISADRRTFELAHVALRYILADRLDCHPRDVRICCDRGGKPRVIGSGSEQLFFNIS